MARYQVIDTGTGHKLRVIEWDGTTAFDLPDGQRIEPDDGKPIWSAPASGRALGVDEERDRRLELGVAFAGRTFQTREFDIANLTGAATAAVAAMMQGAQPGDYRWADPTTDFGWIDRDNVLMRMDAPTLIALAQAAMARRSALIFAGRRIKDRLITEPGLDISSDALWPA